VIAIVGKHKGPRNSARFIGLIDGLHNGNDSRTEESYASFPFTLGIGLNNSLNKCGIGRITRQEFVCKRMQRMNISNTFVHIKPDPPDSGCVHLLTNTEEIYPKINPANQRKCSPMKHALSS
jgi:hypothetical protein